MTYVGYGPDLVFFTEQEVKLIDKWLTDHGYEWYRATVCGSCCGFYADEYWVGGIGGEWKSGEDYEEFVKFAKRHGIACEADVDDYHIRAIKVSLK